MGWDLSILEAVIESWTLIPGTQQALAYWYILFLIPCKGHQGYGMVDQYGLIHLALSTGMGWIGSVLFIIKWEMKGQGKLWVCTFHVKVF